LPIGLYLAAGNVADITAAPLALAQVKVPRRRGRPRTRPVGLAADRGYDGKAFRLSLVRRGIRHSIPLRRAPNHGKLKYRPHTHRELSGNRWVVERFFAWLNGFRRITQRFERYAFMYEALLHLACAWICLRRLLQ
jgi:transposase